MTDIRIGPYGPFAWIDLVMIVWFGLVAFSVAYVAWDAWRNDPELKVMKWGWILVTLFLGPVALLLYVLSCKEPRPGTHETFITPLWKQGLGSTIHCVAGDAHDGRLISRGSATFRCPRVALHELHDGGMFPTMAIDVAP